MGIGCCMSATGKKFGCFHCLVRFLAFVTSNGSPHATGPMCCLSIIYKINVAVLWPNRWMDQDATWYGGKPPPRRHCVRWQPSSPTETGMAPLPTFRPMSIVAKRSLISATAALLFYRASTYSTALRIRRHHYRDHSCRTLLLPVKVTIAAPTVLNFN